MEVGWSWDDKYITSGVDSLRLRRPRAPTELSRLRQLEEENNKLKRLVADLGLGKAMLQDVLSKKRGSLRACVSMSKT